MQHGPMTQTTSQGTHEALDVGTQTISQGMHEALNIGMQIGSHGTHETLNASIRLCRRVRMKPRALTRIELFTEHNVEDCWERVPRWLI